LFASLGIENMKAKIIKIVGWTLGMTVGVYLITDGKSESQHPLEHALIGASIGLVLGFFFAASLKTSNTTVPDLFWKKAWVSVRFVLFGVLGLLVMIGAWVMFLDRLTSIRRENGEMTPFLFIPLSLLGAVMMLFGVGEWGRWGYLLVFLSIPVSLSLLFLIPAAGEDVAIIVPALAAACTYAAVRRFYGRRNIREVRTS
jgi:hypothetical protein